MRIRILNKDNSPLAEATLIRAWPTPGSLIDEVELVHASRDPTSNAKIKRTHHCHVRFDGPTKLPLWYSGSFTESFADFSLPSGFHNVWGCGNDFDTDAFKIDPAQIDAIIKLLE